RLRQLGKRAALNGRAREAAVFVVDLLEYEKPKTNTHAELLGKLGVNEKKVVVLTAGAAHAHNVYLSGRNIPKVRVMRFADATAYEILWADAVVVELPALGEASEKAEVEGKGEGGAEDAGPPPPDGGPGHTGETPGAQQGPKGEGLRGGTGGGEPQTRAG